MWLLLGEFPNPGNNKALVFLRGPCFEWCGTRRTVAVSGARFSVGLEVGGKFGVSLQVTINKSASYGSQWSRTGTFRLEHVVELHIKYPEQDTAR
jgi:hypothetical protein